MEELLKDDFVPCPYNVAHMIPVKRMPYHLMKCRRQYPSVDYETCPFNVYHVVPKPEIRYHIATCKGKGSVEREILAKNASIEKPHLNKCAVISHNIKVDEFWDEDDTSEEQNTENVMIKRTTSHKPVQNFPSGLPAVLSSNAAVLQSLARGRAKALPNRSTNHPIGQPSPLRGMGRGITSSCTSTPDRPKNQG